MGKKERFYADIMALNPGVTGSCNMVVVTLPNRNLPKIQFLVDCGLFQEKSENDLNEDFPFNPEKIDFCLVTHNHVDHIGRLPLLAKKGFRGKVYTTKQTTRLISLALWDCHKISIANAKRKHKRYQLLYQREDVEQILNQVIACNYNEKIKINNYVTVTFLKNGHLVGAALIYVKISYPGYQDINLIFTGDYKGSNLFFDVDPIPEELKKIPVTIIQESTYGYMNTADMKPCFERNVLKCIENGGTAIVPVFSLGRSQEILFKLKIMQTEGKLSTSIPIFFDGKLALQYTSLYIKGDLGIKEDMKDFLPQNVTFVDRSSRHGVLYNNECKIILTTSGMGSYGPAQTYISNYIGRRRALIHFTGYTAEGTLGARLKGTPYGHEVEVGGLTATKLAQVEYTTEYSAHAKADEMIAFLKQFECLKLVLINHGEEGVKVKFAKRINEEINPKDVEILGNRYFYRINPYGLIKTMSTKF